MYLELNNEFLIIIMFSNKITFATEVIENNAEIDILYWLHNRIPVALNIDSRGLPCLFPSLTGLFVWLCVT